MNFYYYSLGGLLLCPLVINILFRNNSMEKKNKIAGILIAIEYALIAVFRSTSVGIDLQVYEMTYEMLKEKNWLDILFVTNLAEVESFEYGYLILNKLISSLGFSFYGFMAIVSFFIMYSFTKLILNNSKMPWLSFYIFVCMGYFHASMCLTRQYIAMAIVCLSVTFLMKRNIYKFVFLVLFASLFHSTAIFFLLIYPFSKIKLTPQIVLMLSVVTGFIMYYSKEILSIMLRYSNKSYYNMGGRSGEGKGLLVLLFILLATALFFLYKSKGKDTEMSMFAHIFFISVILQILSLQFDMFVRVVFYYSMFMVLFIPNCIVRVKSKLTKNIAIVSLIILLVAYYHIVGILHDNMGVVPYSTFWQDIV